MYVIGVSCLLGACQSARQKAGIDSLTVIDVAGTMENWKN